MGRFLPLFSFKVEHPFFVSGYCDLLEFMPSEATHRLMQNRDVLMKRSQGGIQLFFDDGGSLLTGTDETVSFGFRVYCREPLFQNYTMLPQRSENSILFFENGGAGAPPEEGVPLQREETVSAADLRQLDPPVRDHLLTPRDRYLPPLFLLSISVKNSREFMGGAYRISFGARETFWKYYLTGDLIRRDCFIADRGNGMEFQPLGRQLLADGRESVPFRSVRPIPLRERSEHNFQLREHGPGGGRVLIRRLPVASPHQLAKETINGEEAAVSEIFVNC